MTKDIEKQLQQIKNDILKFVVEQDRLTNKMTYCIYNRKTDEILYSIEREEKLKIGSFMHYFNNEMKKLYAEKTFSEEEWKIIRDFINKGYDVHRKQKNLSEISHEGIRAMKTKVGNMASVKEVVEFYGFNIIKKGKNFLIQCPFHDDHDPSLSIKDGDKIWKCFVCDSKGNAVDFVYQYEKKIGNTDFRMIDAVNKTIDICHLDIEKVENDTIDENREFFTQTYSEEQQKQLSILNALEQFATYEMENNPENAGRKYLSERGIDKECYEKLGFGWLEPNNVQKTFIDNASEEKKEMLYSVAFLDRNEDGSYFQRYKNRVLIPIKDEFGNIVSFSGRDVTGESHAKYLHGKTEITVPNSFGEDITVPTIFQKNNILYHYDVAKQHVEQMNIYGIVSREIFIVEGFMDVLGGIKMGKDNFVATMGTSLSNYQLDLIKKLNCKIVLIRDNDKAGIRSMLKEVPKLINKGFEVDVIDLNAFALSMTSIQIGNPLKDVWDLAKENITYDQMNQARVDGLTYMMKYKYFYEKPINPRSIQTAYMGAIEDGIVNSSINEAQFINAIYDLSDRKYTWQQIESFTTEVVYNNNQTFNSIQNSIVDQTLYQGLRKELLQISKLSGVTFSMETEFKIINQSIDLFSIRMNEYFDIKNSKIYYSHLINDVFQEMKKEFLTNKEQNALSLAQIIKKKSSDKSFSNYQFVSFLETELHIEPILLSKFIKAHEIIGVLENKDCVSFSILERDEDGLLNNAIQYDIYDSKHIDTYSYYPSEKGILLKMGECQQPKRTLCFANTLDMLSYETLLYLNNPEACNDYHFLSIEGNSFSKIMKKFCAMNMTEHITVMTTMEQHQNIRFQKALENINKNYDHILFDSHGIQTDKEEVHNYVDYLQSEKGT